jgi:Mg2+ and Co2+ transporter CorA
MEVLTEVDRGRIEALRRRDEFFWLDLASPSDAELVKLHLHISGGCLFTARRAPCPELDVLHRMLVAEGADPEEYIIYRVLDSLADALYPVVDHFEMRIDTAYFWRRRSDWL